MTIKNWPQDERPREKLLKLGPQALSDAELLAIFLRTGNNGQSAVDLARGLLSRFNGLGGLYAASDAELLSTSGIGPAKVAQIRAAIQLSGRHFAEKAKLAPTLSNPEMVCKLLRCFIEDAGCEEFWGLMLDNKKRLIEKIRLGVGTVNKSEIYPREIIKAAINHGAVKIIFAHNHPSGDTAPSENDKTVTEKLIKACRSVDIEILDHVIIGKNDYFSFAQHELLY